MICTVEAVCGETVFLGGLDVRYKWHVICCFTNLVKRLGIEDYCLLGTLAILASRSLVVHVSVSSQPAEDGLRLHYGKRQQFR